jgi:4,5-dihydroxyphthalate decarboxylase
MESQKLTLSIALADNERTRPILQGRYQPQGVRLIPTEVYPSEMFWRQLRYAEFDISEMSLSTLLIATARGDRRWVALPIYTSRKFFHTGSLVTTASGISRPADFKGKRVGVPEYQQTAAVWARGVLQNEFGVDPREIEWYMERGSDKSHGNSTGFRPPDGVTIHGIPASTNIGEMLVRGELDAALHYGNNRNLVDRSTLELADMPGVRLLFPDQRAEGLRYFAKTGIYPINHTVVIRRELHEQHPWVALNLYHAFVQAKQDVERETRQTLQAYVATGLVDASVLRQLDQDPKAYGMRASRPVLETLARYVHQQGLTDRVVALDELFAASTLEL